MAAHTRFELAIFSLTSCYSTSELMSHIGKEFNLAKHTLIFNQRIFVLDYTYIILHLFLLSREVFYFSIVISQKEKL